ncbi:hypothetical protein [Leifsonia aquatica]|uniref:phage tail tube protein n=1 Tax=Leifsonia aquatica TaxID=144185 RepID=UPI0004682F19|nr:hypothetical protein [Leifsonia aquatica]
MADKVLSADTEAWVLIPATEVLGEPYGIGVAGKDPISAISADLYNEYAALTTRAAAGYSGAGANITEAVKDDSKLEASDSETDSDKPVNASGNSVVPTSENYDAKATIFRDANSAAVDSTYNVANDQVRARGAKFIAVRRIGLAHDALGVAGQKYSAFYVENDHPVDAYGDGANQTIDVTWVTKSVSVVDATLV